MGARRLEIAERDRAGDAEVRKHAGEVRAIVHARLRVALNSRRCPTRTRASAARTSRSGARRSRPTASAPPVSSSKAPPRRRGRRRRRRHHYRRRGSVRCPRDVTSSRAQAQLALEAALGEPIAAAQAAHDELAKRGDHDTWELDARANDVQGATLATTSALAAAVGASVGGEKGAAQAAGRAEAAHKSQRDGARDLESNLRAVFIALEGVDTAKAVLGWLPRLQSSAADGAAKLLSELGEAEMPPELTEAMKSMVVASNDDACEQAKEAGMRAAEDLHEAAAEVGEKASAVSHRWARSQRSSSGPISSILEAVGGAMGSEVLGFLKAQGELANRDRRPPAARTREVAWAAPRARVAPRCGGREGTRHARRGGGGGGDTPASAAAAVAAMDWSRSVFARCTRGSSAPLSRRGSAAVRTTSVKRLLDPRRRLPWLAIAQNLNGFRELRRRSAARRRRPPPPPPRPTGGRRRRRRCRLLGNLPFSTPSSHPSLARWERRDRPGRTAHAARRSAGPRWRGGAGGAARRAARLVGGYQRDGRGGDDYEEVQRQLAALRRREEARDAEQKAQDAYIEEMRRREEARDREQQVQDREIATLRAMVAGLQPREIVVENDVEVVKEVVVPHEVVREVVREVPMPVEVVREVVRTQRVEVPVETEVVKEVIKRVEVPVYKDEREPERKYVGTWPGHTALLEQQGRRSPPGGRAAGVGCRPGAPRVARRILAPAPRPPRRRPPRRRRPPTRCRRRRRPPRAAVAARRWPGPPASCLPDRRPPPPPPPPRAARLQYCSTPPPPPGRANAAAAAQREARARVRRRRPTRSARRSSGWVSSARCAARRSGAARRCSWWRWRSRRT